MAGSPRRIILAFVVCSQCHMLSQISYGLGFNDASEDPPGSHVPTSEPASTSLPGISATNQAFTMMSGGLMRMQTTGTQAVGFEVPWVSLPSGEEFTLDFRMRINSVGSGTGGLSFFVRRGVGAESRLDFLSNDLQLNGTHHLPQTTPHPAGFRYYRMWFTPGNPGRLHLARSESDDPLPKNPTPNISTPPNGPAATALSTNPSGVGLTNVGMAFGDFDDSGTSTPWVVDIDFVHFSHALSTPVYIPDDHPDTGPPDGCFSSPANTFVIQLPAGSFDPTKPHLWDIALAATNHGTFTAPTILIAFGHLPGTLPVPFIFPNVTGTNAGSFLDLTVAWDSSVQGPFNWTGVKDSWSPMLFGAIGGTGFYWNGVSDIGMFVTYQTGSTSGLWDGSVRSQPGSPPGFIGGSGGYGTPSALPGPPKGTKSCTVSPPSSLTLPSEWQMNSVKSHLSANAVVGPPQNPAIASVAVGGSVVIESFSVNTGLPWDLGVSLAPAVPASCGGFTTTNGQFVNLALSGTTFLNGLTFTVPFVSFSLNTSFGFPLVLTGQLVVVDGASPDGFVLSAAAQINVATASGPASVPVVLGDDDFAQIPLAVFGGTPTISFCGTAYSDLFVCSNGFTSFGAGSGDFSATAAEFMSGMPRLAGMWTDLDPSAGGTILVTECSGVFTVSFQGVPEWGSPGVNSCDMVFDTVSGGCSIENYVPHGAHATDTLIGLTCGGPLSTNPGSVSFASLVGLTLPTPPTAMIYEFTAGAAAPQGWTSIVFPFSAPGLFLVN